MPNYLKPLLVMISIFTFLIVCKLLVQKYQVEHYQQELDRQVYALLGDVGGTNIRLQLVSFKLNQNLPNQQIKLQRMKVKDYPTFQNAIQTFLSDIQKQFYPNIAVIGMAGPVTDNSLYLSNVPKWGKILGSTLSQLLKIPHFRLINDFQAISYGLLIVPQTQFVSLNNKSIDVMKRRGVIGPGTGLGHSILFRKKKTQQSIIVLPSEAGQADFPLIDQQSVQYFNFLKRQMNLQYISLQKSFCGPSIPYIYKFYSKKYYPEKQFQNLTSEEIIQEGLKQNSSIVFNKTLGLFFKIYSSAIGNFLAQHICEGGLYLVGTLTKAFMPFLQKMDILKQWKDRHPQISDIVSRIPIVFCNQTDLGLKGAFVYSKKLYRFAIQNKLQIEDL